MNEHDGEFLIVDDEVDMCWALAHLLRKNGFASRTALSARDACRLMETHRFPLAFLDAKLPDIDGLELARRIRESDPEMRILMVSGYFYRDDAAIQQALSEGVICGFISKPFQHQEILAAITSARCRARA